MRAQPHPLSRSFRWQPTVGPFRRISDADARQFDADGFFVLRGALSAETIADLCAVIDPLEASVEEALRAVEGGRIFIARAGEITFSIHLVAHSPLLRDFVTGPLFRDLCADLIGPDVRLYWDQAVYKKPGTESPFPWHQDNGYTFIEPQQYLTCWIALTDATEENGCPWVVPRLHRGGTLAHESTDLGFVCLRDAPEAVAVPARAGDIVVFSSLTPHSTGANRTDSVRKAYIVQFAPEGAVAVTSESAAGRAPARPLDDPVRQFPILIGGQAPETR